MNMQEFLDDIYERLNRSGPPDCICEGAYDDQCRTHGIAAVAEKHVSDFERPAPVNLGRSQCAHCRRMVTEAGKYDHNLSKHPEIYK